MSKQIDTMKIGTGLPRTLPGRGISLPLLVAFLLLCCHPSPLRALADDHAVAEGVPVPGAIHAVTLTKVQQGETTGNSGQLTISELSELVSDIRLAAEKFVAARAVRPAPLRSGRVMVAGMVGSNYVMASAALYDPATNAWLTAGAISSPRASRAGRLVNVGRDLVWAGIIIPF